MQNLSGLFGRSPFEPLVEHARKVHECVALVRPVAEAVLAGDADRIKDLQHEMSKAEYTADQIKDNARQSLPNRYFLPVNREDVARFLAAMDKMADDTEDFAVVATLRTIQVPEELHADFMTLVDKVIEVGESLLSLAEHVGQLQKESFTGPDADDLLQKIQNVCHMEWESDKLSRKLARHYYSIEGIDPLVVIIMDKLCRALTGIADHAENVGKSLRLMIMRR